MTLGETLQKLRKENGLSQEKVARVLFVSRQSVSKWEHDQAEPGVENLKALARLYGVTLDRLMGAEPPEPGGEPGGQSAGAPKPAREPSRAYLFWTALLLGLTVAVGLFTWDNYGRFDIPFSLLAMVVGIWVRYPAMWVVIQCITAVSALLDGISLLLLGNFPGLLSLLVHSAYLLILYTPSIRRRFHVLKRKPMTVLGITGPTGAGKTTALMVVEQLGGAVIDCDRVYHKLLEGDVALQGKLESAFGPLRDERGAIDRKKLGTIVFGDPEKLRQLNEIAQTATVERTRELLERYRARGRELVAVDAIALLESGLKELCQATIAVIAPPETRVERIMAREGIPEDYAWARVRAQRPDEYFIEGCDYTLWNDCAGAEEFALRARTLLEHILNEQTNN